MKGKYFCAKHYRPLPILGHVYTKAFFMVPLVLFSILKAKEDKWLMIEQCGNAAKTVQCKRDG